MDFKTWWASMRVKACDLITNGEHMAAQDGSRFHMKCRICGVTWTLPDPEPPPVPDPPAPDPDPEPPTPPVDPAAEPDPSRPSNYRAGFLWKPSSESSGQLVVLAPEPFTGHIASTWLEFNGMVEKPYGGQIANGNRWHSRFLKAGASYPIGTMFRLKTDAGRVWTWTINNPGSRVQDNDVTPTVIA